MIRDPLSEEALSKIFKTSPQNPDRLIKREDKNHEFKESYNRANMATYLKTMAAFANNDGGYIVFGIKDNPREMIGLSGKALDQFNSLPVEELTALLNEYFSPSIDWTSCLFHFKGRFFGIIYVYKLKSKPTICKKAKDNANNKYALKEADIYYRYAGQSKRIGYPELQQIIDEKRRQEEKNWLQFLVRAAKIGVDNASLIDLANGEVREGGSTLFIDETLLGKMRFIKEGHFVEKDGAPALRIVGDIQSIESGKVVVGPVRKVVRAIEQTDIIEAFLSNEEVENPVDYIKRICSSTTGKLPVYYFIGMAGINTDDALKIVQDTTARGQAKRVLTARLEGGPEVTAKSFPVRDTAASTCKRLYKRLWCDENISEVSSKDLPHCLSAILYLTSQDVKTHETFLKSKVLELYKQHYEHADSGLASAFRGAICYIDCVLFKKEDPHA